MCGETDKVYFIFQHWNPLTGVSEEEHYVDAPQYPLPIGAERQEPN
jgi:hypothetical protein